MIGVAILMIDIALLLILKMIISFISDWEKPASKPDLSTNYSTFVPPAEEKSDEEEPEVERRQRR